MEEMRKFVLKNACLLANCMIFFLISCQSNQYEERSDEIEKLNKENFISYDLIRSKAVSLFEKILTEHPGGGNKVRSNPLEDEFPTRTISNILTFNDNRNITSCYAVNFYEGGFIVISADKRVPEILAFSEDNSFMPNPEESNEEMPYGVTIWLNNVNNIISAIRYDSLENEDLNNSDNDKDKGLDNYSNEVTTRDFPTPSTPYMLTTKWGQSNGYNDSLSICNVSTGQKMVSGCATVAIAQLLKYFPNSTYYTYKWFLMEDNYATPETAKLYKHIVSISHATAIGCDTTSTSIGYVLITFSTYGFSYTNSIYNFNTVKTYLLNNSPVFIYGGNHGWVCDGYFYSEEIIPNLLDPNNPKIVIKNFLHMNWGWSGSYNGWYDEATTWSPPGYTCPDNDRNVIYIY